MEWVASTLHTILEHYVSSITTADAHTSAASSRLNWHPVVLNGLVHFVERRNLVSVLVPSHFKRSLLRNFVCHLEVWSPKLFFGTWQLFNVCCRWLIGLRATWSFPGYLNEILLSSEILGSEYMWLVTDVSGLLIGPVFKIPAVKEECWEHGRAQ